MSRRKASPLSLILLGLGVFLLVLAPMLAFYVEPRAKLNPVDIESTTRYEGTGTFYDTDAQKERDNQELTIVRRVLGDVAASDDDTAVWDAATAIDTPLTRKVDDPRRAFQFTTERWVMDRETNAPEHCCGEDTGVDGKRFGGDAYLKFPFDVEKRTYRWWDSTAQDTVALEYAGEKEIQGYTGLAFTGEIEPVKTGTRQVPGVMVGLPDKDQVFADEWYANEKIELVADERTGRIIYASIAPKKTLRQPGGGTDEVTLLQSDGIEFTEETQKEQVDLADEDSSRLKLVGETLPVVALVAGFVLAGAGAVLLARGGRPDEPDRDREPDGVPPQPVAA
ncbi:hypothetical protein GCM10010400_06460 [Streptomyces aculeolatus]|uniref:DUF3068 domain-containing protein n=1 Tax=Streptomyces aculeolatus TaxID=270689 RepID=UPI001CEDF33F|nr:DUF3068 domain-containing protein [Streptomyces aculeolatus]